MLFAIFLAQYAFQWDADALLENRRNIVKTKKSRNPPILAKTCVSKVPQSTSVFTGFFCLFGLILIVF